MGGKPPPGITIIDNDFAAMWAANVGAPAPDPKTNPCPTHNDTKCMPIKNTFIQYDNPNLSALWHSAPSIMLHEPFKLKITPEQKAHLGGECKPCLYYHMKKDGCRMGK